MKILIGIEDLSTIDSLFYSLKDDLDSFEISENLNIQMDSTESKSLEDDENKIEKGDPITIGTIILTLVSAGGAVAVSVGEGGFFTRLADMLESYVNRKLDIKLELKDGTKFELNGHARDIQKILEEKTLNKSEE